MHQSFFQRKMMTHKQQEFYRHLRFYLCFIGSMLFLQLFLGFDMGFYSVAFWWGFGVAIHYVRVFGDAGLTEWSEPQESHYEKPNEPEAEEIVELRLKQPAWRDRDLV